MQQYLKAIYAAALAGLGAASTAYAQGNGHIGYQAGIAIATAVLTTLGVVWAVPNESKSPAPPAG